jgi:hypothetical protein
LCSHPREEINIKKEAGPNKRIKTIIPFNRPAEPLIFVISTY